MSSPQEIVANPPPTATDPIPVVSAGPASLPINDPYTPQKIKEEARARIKQNISGKNTIQQKWLNIIIIVSLVALAVLSWILLVYALQLKHDIKKDCTCTSDHYEDAEEPIIIISAVTGGFATLVLIIILMLWWFSSGGD